MRAWPRRGEGWTGEFAVIGEAPGSNEDTEGRAFIGESGQILRKVFREAGIDPDVDVLWTNVIRCRPPSNRTPSPRELKMCRELLEQEIRQLGPRRILAVGETAARVVTGVKGKAKLSSSRHKCWLWHGIPCIITYHPAFYLRQHGPWILAAIREDVEKLTHEWVQPYPGSFVEVAGLAIDKPVAFDLEWAADGRLLVGKFLHVAQKEQQNQVVTPQPVTGGVKTLAEASLVAGHNVWGDIHRLIANATDEELGDNGR